MNGPAPTDPRDLMDLFPQRERGTIAQRFYDAVRGGVRDADAVVAWVHAWLRTDIARCRESSSSDWPGWAERRAEQAERDEIWAEKLLMHPAETRAFAQYVIEREQLPRAVREAEKQARSVEYARAYMAQQPPTDKQLAYLRKLGHRGEVGSKAEASELIDRHVRQQERD